MTVQAVARLAQDILPPQDARAERDVLGSCLLNQAAADAALEKLTPADFYSTKHQIIFRIISELRAGDQPVDQATVRGRLMDSGEVEVAGGEKYLAELAGTAYPWQTAILATTDLENTLDLQQAEAYVDRVLRLSRLRRLIATLTGRARDAYEMGGNPDHIVAQLDRELMALANDQSQEGADGATLADELARELGADSPLASLPTGIPPMDSPLGGLRQGDLILAAARANTGKTTLALNLLRNLISAGVWVLFFSLEMSRRAITKHLIRQRTAINLFRDFRKHPLTDFEQAQVAAELEVLRGLPLIVEDRGSTLASIRSKTRRAVTRGRCGLVILDYLQRIHPAEGATRNEEVAAIARGLKTLAVDANVPVLALCQLNRESTKREGGRPRLCDLRDSGELEQEADAVFLLHRPNKERPGGDDGQFNVDLAKSRNTACGEWRGWLDLPTGWIYSTEYELNTARGNRTMTASTFAGAGL